VLEEMRDTGKRELASLNGKREGLEAVERDRDPILRNHATLAVEPSGTLSGGTSQGVIYTQAHRRVVGGQGLENERRVRRGVTDLGNRRNVKTFLP
jgi:hypothetical protein